MWTGTASDLLGALAEEAGDRVAKSKSWPDGARALAGRLRRAATFLRKIGIETSFEREGRARTRTICITKPPAVAPKEGGIFASASSAPSASTPKSSPGNGLREPDPRTVDADADAKADGAGAKADGSGGAAATTVRANPLKTNGRTDADGADANPPLQSGLGKAGGWRARL